MSTERHDLTQEKAQYVDAEPKLLYISTASYGSDWHCVPHTHTCAELFYILRGKGRFLLDHQSLSIETGDLVFVNPLVRHTEAGLEGQSLEYMVIGVENLELSGFSPTGENHCFIPARQCSGAIRECLEGICREIRDKASGYEQVCQYLLKVLAIHLLRQGTFTTASTSTGKSVSKESARIRRYIDHHFKEPVNLDQLAQIASLNKYHLSHIFTRDYGISPINYLLSLRIRESRMLLRSTDHTLAQIAQLVGFSSPSYFSQSFRKATGISPAQYRKQNPRNDLEPFQKDCPDATP